MELMNGTPETITLMYDNIPYVFGPGDVMSLDDEAGVFLEAKGKSLGIVRVGYKDNPDAKMMQALQSKVDWYKQQISDHETAQEKQKQSNLPLLPELFGIRVARQMLPIYDKLIGELREKLNLSEVPAPVREAQEFLANQGLNPTMPEPKVTQLEDMTIDELRKIAANKSIAVDPRWNSRTLVARIREADSTT